MRVRGQGQGMRREKPVRFPCLTFPPSFAPWCPRRDVRENWNSGMVHGTEPETAPRRDRERGEEERETERMRVWEINKERESETGIKREKREKKKEKSEIK